MPHSHPDIRTPCDTLVNGDDHDWRLALRIVEDSNSMERVDAVAGIKTISRSQFDSGQNVAIEVLIENRVIAVFRHAGAWYAVDGMCAHQGGPLADGVVRDGCVTCPWHGWQYDLATGIQMINHQPLQESFPIRQIDDRVEIRVSRENSE